LRKRSLEAQFKRSYLDLLQAVESGNYEAIESICEEGLTLELAAKIYEFSKFKNAFFKVLCPDSPVKISILNHFHISNAFVDRKKNPPLEEFEQVRVSSNHLRYERKEAEDKNSEQEMLEVYSQLQSLYSASGVKVDPTLKNFVPSETSDREITERERFENNDFLQKESKESFREFKQGEYSLTKKLTPKALRGEGFEEQFEEHRN
jgi:hypothetical protein